MKNTKLNQGLATGLTALATAMLCQTTATYASDIQIYKAPTSGGAYLMMVLDFSTSMRGSSPIKSDFFNGTDCTSENHTVSTTWDGVTHSFPGTYCYIKETTRPARKVTKAIEYIQTLTRSSKDGEWRQSSYVRDTGVSEVESLGTVTNRTARTAYSSLPSKYRDKVDQSCIVASFYEETRDEEATASVKKGSEYDIKYSSGSNSYQREKKQRYIQTDTYRLTTETGNTYSCPDRVTMLKKSIYDLVAGNSTVNGQTTTITPLVETASIGFTRFPNPSVAQVPVVLNTAGRSTLLSQITSYSNTSGTPISHAYATGAAGLMENMPSGAEAACAGYGVYMLTDGEPYSDNRGSARTAINGYLPAASQITSTQCSGSGNGSASWQCVEPIAQVLQEKKNTKNLEIKTAIVGFGSDFSFQNSSGNGVPFNLSYTADEAEGLFSGSNQKAAARAAVVGKGGWFSATNTTDIVQSVQEFVASIAVEIPSITTGTSAIPQDALNSSVIQPYAYFPQFQPKPSNDTQAWTGNLKKYRIIGGVLTGKNGTTSLFSSAGDLNPAAEDLWAQNYASSTTLTEREQELKTLGGLLSRLNLKSNTNNTAFQRKIYTNSGATVSEVNKAYIEGAPATRGYFLGMMGYNINPDQIAALGTTLDLSSLNAHAELRQIGAVMHSTPVLLTQSGTITYSNGVNTNDRDDYILFGTTQGALHVVKAGTTEDMTGIANTAGNEVFAFVPEEMLSNQPTTLLDPQYTPQNGMEHLYYGVDAPWTAHTEYVYEPGTATTADPAPDGTFKVYHSDAKKGKQWVYGGLRMGGRSYYALDLTRLTATTNSQPVVKFRINPAQSRVDGFTHPTTENTRYANLAKMGQSWSKPVIANVQWKGQRRLVMFVGGGYDEGYESFNYNQTNGVGAGVYMFDAETGEFLWSTYDAKDTAQGSTKTLIGHGDELKYSVVSQIKVVDREGDGDVDHLYFGDLGGQVFRVDLDKDHAAATGTHANYAQQITRIYNGNNTTSPGYSPRFYEMPAFTVYNGTGGLFAVLSIGSGNRSVPLVGKKIGNTYIVSGESNDENAKLQKDAIYNIYDKVVVKDDPHNETLVTSPTLTNLHALTAAQRELAATSTSSPTPANIATWKENSTTHKGWYFPFTSPNSTRNGVEKVQGDLIAIDNDLYVSTFDAEGVGSSASCGAGIYGSSRAHRFCMPYGQCNNGDAVANNTLQLGVGLLGITVGPGSSAADRRIISSVPSLISGNKITELNYTSRDRLIPQSWYEKH